MIYLASPYAHPRKAYRQWRFEMAAECASLLIARGEVIFSPIVHSHCIAEYLPESTNSWDFWSKQDLPILARCDKLYVLMLPLWNESKGMRAEIAYARDSRKPVHYLTWPFKTIDGDL